jgi:mannosyl-oligosaccharide glucosidase
LLSARANEISQSFHSRFTKSFPLSPPFTSPRYETFAKQALSSLLGGIAYFHGTYLVSPPPFDSPDSESDPDSPSPPILEGPAELFTATPSRPFFPRGFYWDEGFHLLPLAEWDNDLMLEILASWFNLMDSDGWIAREQILGEESRKKVPAEFQVQNTEFANPPTLLMPLERFIERVQLMKGGNTRQMTFGLEDEVAEGITSRYLSPELARGYLVRLYPLLVRHHDWFRRTQSGEIKSWDREAYSSKEGYRWRGRTATHCLTSGLDDYPRCQPPHPAELNLDLLSWMGYFARTMRRVAEMLGYEDDVAEFQKQEEAIVRNIDGIEPLFVRVNRRFTLE